MDESGIRYVVLRNYEYLPEWTNNDVDVLVDPKQWRKAEHALLYAATLTGWRLHHRAEFSPISLFFSAPTGSSQIHIDIFKDLVWRGAEILPAESVLSRRRPVKNFYVPDKLDEAILNLLTRLLYAGYIKDKYKPTILQTFHEDKEGFINRLSERLPKRLVTQVVSFLESENWEQIEKLLPTIRVALMVKTLKRDPGRLLMTWVQDAKRLLIRALHPPGLMVVLIGPDGSGKSTIAQHIVKELNPTFPADKALHRHWKPCFLPRRTTKTDEKWIKAPHARPPRRPLTSVLIFFYHWLDFLLGYYFKYFPTLFRNGLVIVERHYYDFFVDQRRYLLKVPLWLVRLGYYFLPPPDLVILLDAPPLILFQRKQEIPLQEIQRQCAEFRNLIKKIPQGITVDCTPPIEAVVKNATFAILEFLSLRVRRQWPKIETNRYESLETLTWIETLISGESHNTSTSFDKGPVNKANPSTNGNNQLQKSFYVLPNRTAPKVLVPTEPTQAAIATLHLYNPRRLKGHLLKNALKLTLRYKLVKYLPLAVLNLTTTRNLAHSEISLFEKLEKILQRDDFHLGIFTGTPGVHRKPVVSVVDPEGQVIAIVKIGWNKNTVKLIENEASVLEKLAREHLKSARIPKLKYAGAWDEKFLLILEPPASALEPAPNKITPSHVEFVKELTSFQRSEIPLIESPFWETVSKRVDYLEKEGIPFWTQIWATALNKIEKNIGKMLTTFGLAHMDFVPWNTYLADGNLYVFDWEYSQPLVPAGWDIMHFYLQTEILVNRNAPRDIWRQTQTVLHKYASELQPNYQAHQLVHLFAFYVVNVSSWYVARDGNLVDGKGYYARLLWQKILQMYLASVEI